MGEFELKLGVPAAQVPSLREAFVAHGAQPLRLQASYFDTADGLLARHRMALRLRLEDGRWVQTLKTAGDGVVHRQEHEVRLDAPAASMPALAVERHAGSGAGRALLAALAATPRVLLQEQQATDMLRLRVMLHTEGGTDIEAALDIGEVRAAGRSSPVLEVELEHKSGPLQGVFELAGAWIGHGGLWLSTLTKAERGERLLRPAGVRPRVGAGRAMPREPGAPRLTHPELLAALRALLAPLGDLAEGSTDATAVRQAIAGLRALRPAVRRVAPGAAGWDAALAAAAAALSDPAAVEGGAPGIARDRALQSALVAILAMTHGAA